MPNPINLITQLRSKTLPKKNFVFEFIQMQIHVLTVTNGKLLIYEIKIIKKISCKKYINKQADQKVQGQMNQF